MRLSAVILALGLSLSAPANAATFVATYTGTVSQGDDGLGVFVAAGSSLSGFTFTSVFTLTYPTSGANEVRDGNTHVSTSQPWSPETSPLTAVLTINGISHAFEPTSYALISAIDGNGTFRADQLDHWVENWTQPNASGTYQMDQIHMTVSSWRPNFIATPDFTADLDYAVEPGDSVQANFVMAKLTTANGGGFLGSTRGSLAVSRITIQAVQSVPEPTAWATMIAGFALVGGSMRRRRRFALTPGIWAKAIPHRASIIA